MTREEWLRELAEWERLSDVTEADRALDALWKALGIVPAGDDSRHENYVMMRANQGYVEPGGKRVYYFTDTPSRLRSRALQHGLVHALQYQRAPLYDLGDRSGGYLDDVSWARDAAAEAEAVLLELAWPGVSMEGLREKVERLASELPRGSSKPYAVRGAYFSYIAGARYLLARARGTLRESIDAMYASPPMSTEQVLHPERADPPIAVSAPDDSARLGDGWKLAAQTVLGEWTVADWVRALDPKPLTAAEQIGGGLPDTLRWGGDLAQVFRRGDDWRCVVWIEWDDEASAARFEGLLQGSASCARAGRRVAVGFGGVSAEALDAGLQEVRTFPFRSPGELRAGLGQGR